jgi:hypothetical protein
MCRFAIFSWYVTSHTASPYVDKRRPDIAHFVTSMGDNLKTINDSTASKMKAL